MSGLKTTAPKSDNNHAGGWQFALWVAVALFMLVFALPSGAQSITADKYADERMAIELAALVDKGTFAEHFITSTFVQDLRNGHFGIKVVLSNGVQQVWNMHQVRTFTQEEVLVLAENRALLFPSMATNEWVVFDKAAFVQAALSSDIYVKQYQAPDLLAGQTIYYAIRNFNLADLMRIETGKDAAGYRRQYVLVLENGIQEYLSQLEAHRLMERGAFTNEAPLDQPVMDLPYRLMEVIAHPLEATEGGGYFVVELAFDRPVDLTPRHFPFRVREAPGQNPRIPFLLEVTLPNAAMGQRLQRISNLEYIHNVQVISDPVNPDRLILQANVTDTVLDQPPQVIIEGDSSVYVAFFKVNRQPATEFLPLFPPPTSVPEQLAEGQRLLSQATKTLQLNEAMEYYLEAHRLFVAAAIQSLEDALLYQAIRGRNQVEAAVANRVIALAKSQQATDQLSSDTRDLVEQALGIVTDSAHRQTLQQYR